MVRILGCVILASVLFVVGCGESPKTDSEHHQVTSTADSGRGKVNCCTRPSCETCVEKFGKCTCLDDLKAGKPICGECIQGYKAGKGKLKLITIPKLKKREGT
jgi:hypothetical protein